MSAALHSVSLIEDHVHSLGQVVHSAISRHRWVPLITGPEGGDTKTMHLRTRRTGRNIHLEKQEALAVWNTVGHDGQRRFRESLNKQNYSTDCDKKKKERVCVFSE